MSTVIKQFSTLFGKDKSGKTRVWNISVQHSDSKYLICVSHGVQNGAMVTSTKEVKAGKNIGKKNETTIEQQALQIAEKTFKDKIEKDGYSETEKVTQSDRPARGLHGSPDPRNFPDSFQPMLAESWNPESKVKRKVDIVFPCVVQPKLDGVRCISFKSACQKWVNQSRELKTFYHLDHINSELEKCNSKLGYEIVFDGELYKHNTPFNHIVGVVKKVKAKEADLEKIRQVSYFVYDCIIPLEPDMPFSERLKILKECVTGCDSVVLVKSDTCVTKEDAQRLHSQYVEDNYEGLILRNIKGPYEHFRSRHLQKYKTFDDAEFKIVGFKEGEGNDAGTVVWKCVTENEKTFDVRPKGTVEERKEWFQNADKMLGSLLTVKYQGMSEYGVPRFPVGIAVRDYE